MNCNQQGYSSPFIQLPNNTDPEMLIKLLTFLESRKKSGNSDADIVLKMIHKQEKKEEKRKKEQEEEAKKKKEREAPKPPSFSLMHVIMITSLFGLPVGALNLWILTTVATMIKEAILK